MKKYRERKKNFHMVFVDWKKALDSTLRNINCDSLAAKGISRSQIEAIRDICERVKTSNQTPIEITDALLINVSLNQGSTLSS